MTAWSLEMPCKELPADAPMHYIRGHLGEELCALFDLLEGGRAEDDRLRAVASIAIDVEHLATDEAERSALIAMVPGPKQRELAQRLDLANDEQTPLEYLRGLKWTADECRELLKFFFDTGQKGCRWGHDGRSHWKCAKRLRSHTPGARACALLPPHSADACSWLDAGTTETGSSMVTEPPAPTGALAHAAPALSSGTESLNLSCANESCAISGRSTPPPLDLAGALPLPTPHMSP